MSDISVDVRALAKLARVALSDDEVTRLEGEIPAILHFVETIQKANVSGAHADISLRNVMRDDTEPYEGGIFSKALLDAAPSRVGDRVAVKQVVSRKK